MVSAVVQAAEGLIISISVQNRIWPGWFGCFATALTLYAATASRGAQWQDSGYFILRAVIGELMNPLGLALIHPLHYGLSRLAVRLDLLEPAYAVTLISSLAGAIAVANVYGCVTALAANRRAALLAAASLALANTFWQLSTIAEVYSLTAALLTAECWCLIVFVKSAVESTRQSSDPPADLQRRLRTRNLAFAGMFFFNGLSLSNHNFALLSIPLLIVATFWAVNRGHISARLIALSVCLWLVGSSPYLGIVATQGLRTGNWRGALNSALFGGSFRDEVLSASVSAQRTLINAGFVLLNFPNLLIPAAVYGLQAIRKSDDFAWLYRLLFLGLVIHALFAFRYPVVDQYCFFIPTYIFLSLFGGMGFARWMSPPSSATARAPSDRGFYRARLMAPAGLLILATPFAYIAVPALARRWDALGYFNRNKPYRDDYVYLFRPWSVLERSADRMSREAVNLAGPSGVIIVEDQMAEYAVRYQVARAGRQVTVVDELAPRDLEEAASAGRSIVLVPRDVDQPITLSLTGSWRRVGDLYVLEPG